MVTSSKKTLDLRLLLIHGLWEWMGTFSSQDGNLPLSPVSFGINDAKNARSRILRISYLLQKHKIEELTKLRKGGEKDCTN